MHWFIAFTCVDLARSRGAVSIDVQNCVRQIGRSERLMRMSQQCGCQPTPAVRAQRAKRANPTLATPGDLLIIGEDFVE